MESDQNRPQADGVQRPPADSDPSPGHAGEAEFAGFRADQPRADRAAHTAAEPHQGYTAEPDFSGFQPDVRETLLPRWLHLSLLWLLGLGAGAALIMAGMFVTQERKTDKTLELLAVSARGGIDVPATPAVAPLPEKKPSDMVFLPDASQAAPAKAGRARVPAHSASPAAPLVSARQGGAGADTGLAVAPPAVKAAPAKAAPAKAKPTAKKKKPKPKKATALARRGETQTWPRRRGDSITERLNAAVAACRARPHAPGECNLRACDILGSSDPACR